METDALSTMDALIRALDDPDGVSRSATSSRSPSAYAWAMSRATTGSGSVAVISRMTVSGTTSALT